VHAETGLQVGENLTVLEQGISDLMHSHVLQQPSEVTSTVPCIESKQPQQFRCTYC